MRSMRKAVIVLAAAAPVACAQTAVPTSDEITGIEWTLVEVNGTPVDTAGLMRPATLLLETEGRASGSTSCNQFTGPYTIDDDSFRFGDVAMTRMACMEGMTVETEYSKVFDATDRWRVVDGRLELLSGDTVLARFVR